MSPPIESARRRAREVAFRVAYQADVMGEGFASAWRTRREESALSEDQGTLVGDVMRVLEQDLEDVDALLATAAAHWPLERMAATDRAVLRTAIAELLGRTGTPARVILDEAIDLAKRYGSEGSGRFVNGVLDTIAHQLRPDEF